MRYLNVASAVSIKKKS